VVNSTKINSLRVLFFSSAFVSDGVCGLSAVRMTLTIVGNAAKAILCNEIKGQVSDRQRGQ